MQPCNNFAPFAFLLKLDGCHREEEEGHKPHETDPNLKCKDHRPRTKHALSLDRGVLKYLVFFDFEVQLRCIPLAASFKIMF